MEELSRTVERLTREHLSIVVKVLATDNHGEDYVKHGLATEVLRFFFGNKWTNENAFDVHKQVERYHRDGRKFLENFVGVVHQAIEIHCVGLQHAALISPECTSNSFAKLTVLELFLGGFRRN